MDETQIGLFQDNFIKLESSVKQDDITKAISNSFDYDWQGINTEKIILPELPKDFNLGVIVGSSGSGKSTIAKQLYGEPQKYEWDCSKSIASNFSSAEEASNKFGAAGLNSIPTWLKPYNVLSVGEKFRADVAMQLKDDAVIDEFTSTVNRETAISCSCAISKYIREKDIKRVVLISCHDDILPYLQPDWIWNTDTNELIHGRWLQRPQIELAVYSCSTKAWDWFKKYHYLSEEIHPAAVCYLGVLHDRPVAFASLLALPGRDVTNAWREHRVVVHPDFQGMGIGNKFSEALGQAYVDTGHQYFCKTANPRMGEHRNKSPLWKPTGNNMKARESYLNADGSLRDWNPRYGMKQELVAMHAHRICYSHEYIGSHPEDRVILPCLNQREETSEILIDQISLF